MRKVMRKLSCVLCVMTLVLSSGVFVTAKETSLKTGFVEMADFNCLDANNEWRGYDVELLHKISQSGDFSFEIVPFESTADVMDALDDGMWIFSSTST